MREIGETVVWIVLIAFQFAVAVGCFATRGHPGFVSGIGAFFLVMAILTLIWRFYTVSKDWDW